MLNSLQACRAVAALLVVLLHTSVGIFSLPKYFGHKPYGPIFDFGFAGVDFFFVLAGFLMMHVHKDEFGKPRALPSCFWKRFSRIYPVYWVVFLLILPVFFFIPNFGFDYQRDPDVIVRAFLLFPHPEGHQILGVAWTLVYEVFFYVLFGLFIFNPRIGFGVLVVWTAGMFAYPWFSDVLSPFCFNNMNLRFVAGICVAVILARWNIPWPRTVALLGAAVFFSCGMAESYAGPLSMWWQAAGFTTGSALMILGLVHAERSGLVRPPRWLVYLGNASYSIYLVHFLALSVLAKLAVSARLDAVIPLPILFWLHVAGAVATGCVCHHLVEAPIHMWTRRRFRRAEKVPVVPIPERDNLRHAA